MISKDDLLRIGRTKGFKNIGYMEKDYLLELLLFIISKETKDELIFKGGTCLYKFYGLSRFSEDIDFSATREININNFVNLIQVGLSDFGMKSFLSKRKEPFNSVLLTFKIEGPLYQGDPQTLCNLRCDINLKSTVEMKPEKRDYSSLYLEIPPFSTLIMNDEEILEEKIRAVMTRDKARDVYDLWFLLNKKVPFNRDLLQKKLDYYELKWDYSRFKDSLLSKENLWDNELRLMTFTDAPPFNEVSKFILSKIKK